MVMKKKQFFLATLKEALKIPYRNPNFIVFSFLSSVPLFTFMLINDFIIQRTLIQTAKILTQTLNPNYLIFSFNLTLPGVIDEALEGVSLKVFLLGFLYFGVLHFLDLLNIVAIVDSASVIYKGEEEETPMNLKDMLCRSFKETRFKGPLITFIYTLMLASLVFVGLISLAAHIFMLSHEVFLVIIFVILFIALLIKAVEWSALWNMTIVMSVVEEKHGDVALVLSSYHSRGSRQSGFVFMLLLLVFSSALRGSCLYMGWSEGGNGIGITSAYVALVCLGNIFKWLVFVVYLHNCRNNQEVGKQGYHHHQEVAGSSI